MRKGKTDNYILVDGEHQPIISPELWVKVQARRKLTGKKSEKVYQGDYLLSGLLRYPKCGASMQSHRSKKNEKCYRYYICSASTNKGAALCRSYIISADYAEEEVLNRIIGFINNPDLIHAIVQKINSRNNYDITSLKKELEHIERRIKEIKSREDRYIDLYVKNIISESKLKEYLEKKDRMNQN